MKQFRDYARLLFLAGSLALYLVSLSLPALLFGHHEPLLGVAVLSSGWWGFVMFQFAWGANPAYAFALYSYLQRQRARASVAGAIALFLGLTSFQAQEWWFNEGSGTPIIGLGIGFQFWMLSFLCLLAGCAFPVTPKPSEGMRSITIDCGRIQSETDLWSEYIRVADPEGSGNFGRNLDSFWDGLNGGPGWPGRCELRFINTYTLSVFQNGQFLETLRDIAQKSTHVKVTLE
jgi:ribonuclease inhibitor